MIILVHRFLRGKVFTTDYIVAFGSIKLYSSEKLRIILSDRKQHVREMLCVYGTKRKINVICVYNIIINYDKFIFLSSCITNFTSKYKHLVIHDK